MLGMRQVSSYQEKLTNKNLINVISVKYQPREESVFSFNLQTNVNVNGPEISEILYQIDVCIRNKS